MNVQPTDLMRNPEAVEPTESSDRVDARIGAVLRRMRLARSMTLDTLGQKLGLSYQSIQRYENGCRIPASTLYRLSKILRCDLAIFFDGMADRPAPEYLESARALDRIEDPVVRDLLRGLIDVLDRVSKDD